MSVPPKDQNGNRRYGQWAGNERGVLMDITRCVEEVWPQVGWVPYQCTRLRGHGPDGEFCRQHAKHYAPKPDMRE